MSLKQTHSDLIFFIAMASLIVGVRAENSSGAVVWWVMFSIIALACGSAYLFYLQYIDKKPLGKNHPFYDKELARNQGNAKEEEKERKLDDRNRRSQQSNDRGRPNNRDNRGRPNNRDNRGMTKPGDVRASIFLLIDCYLFVICLV